MVSLGDIIGIFDIHIQDSTDITGLFPGRNREQPFPTLPAHSGDMKSVILTDREIYLSPISSLTLKRRAENLYRDIEEQDSPEATP